MRVADGVRMLYPHDLRDGEHGFTVVSCIGTQVLAVLDGDDEVDYVLDLGTLKGRRITLGPFASPAAAFQNEVGRQVRCQRGWTGPDGPLPNRTCSLSEHPALQ